MRLIRQPKNSRVCGHCCLAMLSGKSLKTIIKIIGHERGTYISELIGGLKTLGIESAVKLKRVYKLVDLPEIAILRLKWCNIPSGHWMLWYKGKLYDPDSNTRTLLSLYMNGPTITSYLKIYIK